MQHEVWVACLGVGCVAGGAHGLSCSGIAAALHGRPPAQLIHQRRQLPAHRYSLALSKRRATP